jgi:hypothetical protein
MEEIYGIEESIFMKMNDMDINAVEEDGRVKFYIDTEQEGYNDVKMDWLNASADFKDITISYNKYLKAQKWIKNVMYMMKKK